MAVFSTIGSIISSNSQNKANKLAAETSSGNNQVNVGLAREIYNGNRQILDPFVQRGNAAGGQINALLGLGGSQQQGGPQAATLPAPNALSQFQGGAGAPYGISDTPGYGFNAAGYGDQYGNNRGAVPRGVPTFQGGNALASFGAPQQQATGVAPANTGQTAQQAADAGFDIFRNSTGYKFRLGEGLDAVNSGYAGSGLLQSGAALRGINEYGQNFASNEFGNYLNALGSQQAVGAGSASSLAGVGQNFAGTVIGSNNLNTQNQIGAQLGRQNPFANALGAFGGSAQSTIGSILGGGFG